MTGALVLLLVVVLVTTRTRKQRRMWKRLIRGLFTLLGWLLASPILLLSPRRSLPLPRRNRRYASGDDRPGQGPRYFTPAQKAVLLELAGHRCERVTWGVRCHMRHDLKADHKVPYSWGGLTTIKNGQILCGHHNDSKGATFADPGGESLPPPWLRKRRRTA